METNKEDNIQIIEGEVEIVNHPDLGKTINSIVYLPENIKIYLRVGEDSKIYINKVTRLIPEGRSQYI